MRHCENYWALEAQTTLQSIGLWALKISMSMQASQTTSDFSELVHQHGFETPSCQPICRAAAWYLGTRRFSGGTRFRSKKINEHQWTVPGPSRKRDSGTWFSSKESIVFCCSTHLRSTLRRVWHPLHRHLGVIHVNQRRENVNHCWTLVLSASHAIILAAQPPAPSAVPLQRHGSHNPCGPGRALGQFQSGNVARNAPLFVGMVFEHSIFYG